MILCAATSEHFTPPTARFVSLMWEYWNSALIRLHEEWKQNGYGLVKAPNYYMSNKGGQDANTDNSNVTD